MENIILEKAYVQYYNNGDYDFTIESKYINFNNYDVAKEYAINNIEQDVEYYFYKSQQDVDNNNSFDTIICNNYSDIVINNMINSLNTELLNKKISLLDADNFIQSFTNSDSSAFDYIDETLEQLSTSYYISNPFNFGNDYEIAISFNIIEKNENPLYNIIKIDNIWLN